MHNATTKIPHLLYEKNPTLKPRMKNVWILFTSNDLYRIDGYDGRWEKSPKEKVKWDERKTHLVTLPSLRL